MIESIFDVVGELEAQHLRDVISLDPGFARLGGGFEVSSDIRLFP
jgi:hypothetical protein